MNKEKTNRYENQNLTAYYLTNGSEVLNPRITKGQRRLKTYPIFSAPERFWNATPATLLPIIAGPPLFPGLMAASICIAISCDAPCTYCVGSTLETTPLVTEMLSPPANQNLCKLFNSNAKSPLSQVFADSHGMHTCVNLLEV